MASNAFAAPAAIELPESSRAAFLRKTYTHLLLAVIAFVGIDAAILLTVPTEWLLAATRFAGGWTWLLILGAFMVVSWVAESMARSTTSLPMQYGGLALYVGAEALLFVPLLTVAWAMGGPGVLATAGVLTGLIFAVLTAFVFISGVDFSFLRGVMLVGGIAAMGAIAISVIFGFTLGVWFTALMIVFAAGAVLYQTSNVMHTYREGQHVAAALGLFAAVALLFWYVLRLVLAFSRD
jgi:FtsH-binding integral membrane protein